jgi:hypothetical protein
LAAATGQHFTRVSKIEHGVQPPADNDIRDWCRACGAEEQVPDLIATARVVESAYLEFRRQARAGMKRVTGAHTLALYERTSQFRIYEHNVIPGLFQTAAYCAAMLSFWIGFLETPADLDAAVAARMQRQKVIFEAGKRFAVVLEEQALRTWFGTAEVQAGQLGRLLEMMSVPTVSLGMLSRMSSRVRSLARFPCRACSTSPGWPVPSPWSSMNAARSTGESASPYSVCGRVVMICA